MSEHFDVKIYKNTTDLRTLMASVYQGTSYQEKLDAFTSLNEITVDVNIELYKNAYSLVASALLQLSSQESQTEVKNLVLNNGYNDIISTLNLILYNIDYLINQKHDDLTVLQEALTLIDTVINWCPIPLGNAKNILNEAYNSIKVSRADTFTSMIDQDYIQQNLFELTITRDLDNLTQTATLSNIPIDSDYYKLGFYDKILITYYDKNDNAEVIFNGFLENFNEDYSPSGEVADMQVLGMLSILNRRQLPNAQNGASLLSWVKNVLQIQKLGITVNDKMFLDFNIADLTEINKGGNIKEKFDWVREKYPVIISEDKQGNMLLMNPFYLNLFTNDVSSNKVGLLSDEDKNNTQVKLMNSAIDFITRIDPSYVISLGLNFFDTTPITQQNYKDYANTAIREMTALSVRLESFYLLDKNSMIQLRDDLQLMDKYLLNFGTGLQNQALRQVSQIIDNVNYFIAHYFNDQGVSTYKTPSMIQEMQEDVVENIYNVFPEGISVMNLDKNANSLTRANKETLIASQEVLAYDLDYTTNINDLKVNSIEGYINTVIVVGRNDDNTYAFGIAMDPYQVFINNKNIVLKVEYKLDESNVITLNQLAAKILLEDMAKFEVVVTLNDFAPIMDIGEYAIVRNHKRTDTKFDPAIGKSTDDNNNWLGPVFIIKKITHVINNTESRTTLTLKCNHLDPIPQNILIGDDAQKLGLLTPDFIFGYLKDL